MAKVNTKHVALIVGAIFAVLQAIVSVIQMQTKELPARFPNLGVHIQTIEQQRFDVISFLLGVVAAFIVGVIIGTIFAEIYKRIK